MKKSLWAKAYGLILAFVLVLAVLTVHVSYRVFVSNITEETKTTAGKLAASEALLLDGDQVQAIGQRVSAIYRAWCAEHGTPDPDAMSGQEYADYLAQYAEVSATPEYAALAAQLEELRAANDVLFLYVTLWDADSGMTLFLLDSAAYGDLSPVGDVEPMDDVTLTLIRQGEEEIPAFTTDYEDYGSLCTAAVPIRASDGSVAAYACADISMQASLQTAGTYLLNLIVFMVVATLVLLPGMLWLFDRFMVKPIKRLSQATGSFMNGTQEKQTPFDAACLKRQDEIGQLYNSLQQMEGKINDYIRDITRITAEKERVGAELHVATQIQADMLPSIFPAFPTRHEFDIYASMAPAKEVGGDFYDFFLVDDDHLAMVMADVSGKGVPAALFMVIAKTLIKNRAQAGGTPAQILADVNGMLCEGNKAQLFVTVWLGILTISTGKGLAANAGHEDPVFRRGDGEFELVRYRHSPAVAAMEGVRFREHEFELNPGDTLFVYTDGVPEATNGQDELYGTDRMLASLNRHRNEPLDSILRETREDINSFVGNAQQFDDMTMLCFTYYGPEGKKTDDHELRLTATR